MNKRIQVPERYANIIYITFILMIFAISLAADLHNSKTHYFTIPGLQLTFILTAVFTIAYLICMSLIKQLNFRSTLTAVMVTGIALRVCYMLFTDSGTRTHDVYRDEWGHIDYIRYIAYHYALPPVNTCQAYHPPIHHIIAAAVLNIGRLFLENEALRLKLIQVVMVFLNTLTLLFFYKALKLSNCSNTAVVAGVSLFAFHPTNIFFAPKINNDNTLMFFYMLSFYFLLKWANTRNVKSIVLLSVFTSMAILTKLSAVILLPIIFAAFLTTLITYRKDYRSYIKQFTVFGLITIPLAFSYALRNYMLFHQSPGYVPSFGKGFTPTFYNLMYLPVDNLFRNPFNNGGLQGGEFFTEFLLKSSLFGEWKYPGLENVAVMLIVTAVINTAAALICNLTLKKDELWKYGYIFILNLIIPVVLAVKFRMAFPVACSQDFRYIAPVLISTGYLTGKAADKLKDSGFVILKGMVFVSITVFCTLSAVFVMSLGYFN